jgi:hypothetical protein
MVRGSCRRVSTRASSSGICYIRRIRQAVASCACPNHLSDRISPAEYRRTFVIVTNAHLCESAVKITSAATGAVSCILAGTVSTRHVRIIRIGRRRKHSSVEALPTLTGVCILFACLAQSRIFLFAQTFGCFLLFLLPPFFFVVLPTIDQIKDISVDQVERLTILS